jgi:F-type H+-transporting ATPase subunit epsilon
MIMADKIIQMEVVTPEKHVCSLETESVIVPAFEGYLGVLPNHAPLITQLGIGVVTYKVGGEKKKMAITGGFMEVANNKMVILADTAELAEEIDVERADAARERAERRLQEKTDDLDYVRAQASLQRAKARLEAAGKLKENKH